MTIYFLSLTKLTRELPFALWFALAYSCLAVTIASPATWAGDYSNREELDKVISSVADQGIDSQWARSMLDSASRQESILKAISRPAEKIKPWFEYRDIFLTQDRILEGVAFWKNYANELEQISRETGVPSKIIVAIVGVETSYGKIMGNYRVIDALVTLALDYPSRSAFFTRELEHFLLLSWQLDKDPLGLKGSYAGAMGYGQFMPSSYRAYARSFDGSDVPDIWTRPVDALSSIGNYLRSHGWLSEAKVVIPAQFEGGDFPHYKVGLKPSISAGSLSDLGITFDQPVDDAEMVKPLRLKVSQGFEYWLALTNFYVITRYNHSALYAMAVWQLSEAIEKGFVSNS